MKGYQKLLSMFSSTKTEVVEKNQTVAQFNPLDAKIGSVVKIDEIDFRDKRFTVSRIDFHEVPMNESKFWFTDYVLDGNKIKVRYIEDSVIVLKLDDEFEYNEDFHNVVKSDDKKFVIDDENTNEHAEFWRVNDVGISYSSRINDTRSIEFWDYSRMTYIDGVEVEEFVIVEIDNKNGWTEIWRGLEVPKEDINVY